LDFAKARLNVTTGAPDSLSPQKQIAYRNGLNGIGADEK